MSDGRRVTITDIADRVGVSPSTVSLVLRGKGAISENTKAAIQKAIDELGYVYDRNAANLRSKVTRAVGLLINDVRNPFFAELATTVQQSAEEGGYLTHLLSSAESTSRQRKYLHSLLEMRVAGAIICPATGTDRAALEALISRRVPTVIAVRPLAREDTFYVGPDNRLAGRLVAAHLLDLGHTRFAFLGGERGNPARDERVAGFRDRLAESGVDLPDNRLLDARPSVTAGAELVERVLAAGGNSPTAIVCYNDLIAFSAMQRLWERGITPGESVALTGFDNLPLGQATVPPLTTVDLRVHEIGRVAASQLMRLIDDRQLPAEQTYLEPGLVIRRTCGASPRSGAA